jgi:hypothetical protein
MKSHAGGDFRSFGDEIVATIDLLIGCSAYPVNVISQQSGL